MSDEAPIQRAIKRICRDLGLPTGDQFTQDWALELPDSFRGYESIPKFLTAYARPDYGTDEKRELMTLMLDILNEHLDRDAAAGHAVWNQLRTLLERSAALHRDQLEYWAQPGEDLEDVLPLAPLARSLLSQLP
jgi:hypothetical protein